MAPKKDDTKTPAAEAKTADEEAAAAAASGDGAGGGVAEDTGKTIAELKQKLADEKEARLDAEQRANSAAGAAAAASNEVEDANFTLVTNAIDTVVATQAALKARYREALAAQDYDAAAETNTEIATNAAKLVNLQAGKAAMEEERKNPKKPPPRANHPGDPVEALAETLTPKSARWVRKHPEYVTDKRLNRKMIRAHEDALDDGCEPDSEEYFSFVESRLGIKAAAAEADAKDADEALSGAAKGAQRKADDATPPALPPARGGSNGKGVRLTPEQKEIAANMGMTEEEYATNLSALRAEGRMTTH